MKLQQIRFADAANISSITFEMTLDEAALLYAICGRTAPKTISDRTGSTKWGETLDDIAVALADIGNRWFENGWRDVLATNLGVQPLGERNEP